ncbi:hypothetical protein Q5P01_006986 [Channa striata]|uniref:Uncharacterized protein n=1 Tax=Channa striata TaxID=64152 RepID=A0AA88NCC5_CHASR|nr:hypothetical protein Q5P01_006986 [Channa striata]
MTLGSFHFRVQLSDVLLSRRAVNCIHLDSQLCLSSDSMSEATSSRHWEPGARNTDIIENEISMATTCRYSHCHKARRGHFQCLRQNLPEHSLSVASRAARPPSMADHRQTPGQ